MPLKIEGGKVTSGDREDGDYRFYTSAVAIFLERWQTSSLSKTAMLPDLVIENEDGLKLVVPKEVGRKGEESILTWLEDRKEFSDLKGWELSIDSGNTLRYRRGQKRKK